MRWGQLDEAQHIAYIDGTASKTQTCGSNERHFPVLAIPETVTAESFEAGGTRIVYSACKHTQTTVMKPVRCN